MGLVIKATGGYAPDGIMTNIDLEKIVETSDEWIRSRTGIIERRIAKDEGSLQMGYKASLMALERAGIAPSELGLIICSTINPDWICPANAYEIMRLLGASCPAFDINAACSGFVYALDIGRKMYEGKPILIVSTEKLSSMMDWTDRNTCILFGDAAGAVILDEVEGNEGLLYTSIMGYPDEQKVLTINNVDGDRFIKMDGQEVFKFATKAMNESIRECLLKTNVSPSDIDWFIPHQANIRIVKNAATKLKVDLEKFYMNIAYTGNTSSASIPFALNEMYEKGLLKNGDKIVLSAFGGGLSSGTALINWCQGETR